LPLRIVRKFEAPLAVTLPKLALFLLDLPQLRRVVRLRAYIEVAFHNRVVSLRHCVVGEKLSRFVVDCFQLGSKVEVCDNQSELLVDQEVLGLDVAVDKAFRVEVFETFD
jgi:hypothetical protein